MCKPFAKQCEICIGCPLLKESNFCEANCQGLTDEDCLRCVQCGNDTDSEECEDCQVVNKKCTETCVPCDICFNKKSPCKDKCEGGDCKKPYEYVPGPGESIFVALHNPDTFHDRDMRKDIYLGCTPTEYYVQYEVKHEIQRGDGQGKVNCNGSEAYDFDNLCVDEKLEQIRSGCFSKGLKISA